MRFAVKPSYLLNIERLKEKLDWPHITEEKGEHGERTFHIKPEHPEGFEIIFNVADDYEDIGTIAIVGVTHWHPDGGWEGDLRWRTIWENLKTVRTLVHGQRCGIEAKRADGKPLYGGVISADGWDDLDAINLYYCLPAGEHGPGELVSAGGKRWRAPIFRRYFFNRPPSDEQPDWSVFVPVKNGWATPRKRDELLYYNITLGLDAL